MKKLAYTTTLFILTLSSHLLQAQESLYDATYRFADKRLHAPCVKIVKPSGKSKSAWSVTFEIRDNDVLRLTSPSVKLSEIPADCHNTFTVAADGQSADFLALNTRVDGQPDLAYNLTARLVVANNPTLDFDILEQVETGTQQTRQYTSLYFSASEDGDSECSFGNVDQCRLFNIRFHLERDENGNATGIDIADSTLTEVLPDTGAVMADVSPDGKHLAFLFTGQDDPILEYRHSYILNLDTDQLLDLTDDTHNGQGDWPHWISDTKVMFSNTNNCPDGSNSPGCSFESRYSDLMLATINTDATSVTSLQFLFGDVDSSGFNSRDCDAGDSVFKTDSASIIAFHSTTIDGKSETRDDACPFVAGFPGINGEPYAGPKPIIWDMNSVAGKSAASDLVAGEDYFTFDMEAAGINSLAHLYFSPEGVVLGTEQNTVEQPLRACSMPDISINAEGLQACKDAWGTVLLYNRIFGFELTGTQYENVRRSSNPRLPLFTHRHPSELPDAEDYYDSQVTGENFQYKYAEFLNSDTTILATVMSHDTNSSDMAFSRLMIIDFADPNAPFYFDLTGWLEPNNP